MSLSALSMGDGQQHSMQEKEEEGELGWRLAQLTYGIMLAGLVDAGFSGDWSRVGYISAETEHVLQQFAVGAVAVNVASGALAASMAAQMEADGAESESPLKSFGAGLLGGAVEVIRLLGKGGSDGQGSGGSSASSPALQMEISSLSNGARISPTGIMLSTSIVAKAGQEGAMRRSLEKLVAETLPLQAADVYTMAVNQDTEDARYFMMLQRFPSYQSMARHQNSPPFKAFTSAAESLVDKPMGLYMVNERNGKMSEPVYPMGPGGEGGRDDAIYSSPKNVQNAEMATRSDIR
jgi:quinol monooxygenase YgiN